MHADHFLDTNIFLYAASNAPSDQPKAKIARDAISAGNFAISSQVAQEFISNALRKPELGLGEPQIDAFLNFFNPTTVLPVTHQLILDATQLRRRYQLSHWHATIVAAALTLGCHTLYTEDLSHLQKFGPLTVVNPFEPSAPQSAP